MFRLVRCVASFGLGWESGRDRGQGYLTMLLKRIVEGRSGVVSK
ncbi:MAG: hypothetical protein VKJ24_04875 [Synechococcales bacterium]|nr:hypothetical protein [Synechococcales bacterium]